MSFFDKIGISWPFESRGKVERDIAAIREAHEIELASVAERHAAVAEKNAEFMAKAASWVENIESRLPYAQFLDPRRVVPTEVGTPRPVQTHPDVLRLFALRCEPVRAIINARRQALRTWEWGVQRKDKARLDMDEHDKQVAGDIEEMIRRDNANGHTFDDTWAKALEDMITLDLGCVELVPPKVVRNFIWAEWWAVDAATIELNLSKRGRFMDGKAAYVQKINQDVMARFRDLSQRNPAPDLHALVTLSQYGVSDINYNGYSPSPVEQVIRTAEAILLTSDFNRSYFTNSKVPPGILDLGPNTTPEDVQEFRLFWESMMREPHTIPIVGGGSVPQAQRTSGNIAFVPFNVHSNKEMQYLEYLNWLYKVACAVMQANPEEIGLESGGSYAGHSLSKPDGTGKAKEGRDKGLEPMLDLISKKITKLIELSGYPEYEFVWVGLNEADKAEAAELAKVYVEAAVYMPQPGEPLAAFNERRKDCGKDPWTQEQYDEWKQAAQEEQQNQLALAQAQGMGAKKSDDGGDDDGGGPPSAPRPPTSPAGKGFSPPEPPSFSKSVGALRVQNTLSHEWTPHPDPEVAALEDALTQIVLDAVHDVVNGVDEAVQPLHKGLMDEPTGIKGWESLTIEALEKLVDGRFNPILVTVKGPPWTTRAIEQTVRGWFKSPSGAKIPMDPSKILTEDMVRKLYVGMLGLAGKDARAAGIGRWWGLKPNEGELKQFRTSLFSEIRDLASGIKTGLRRILETNRKAGKNPLQFANDLQYLIGDWETDARRIVVTETARAQCDASYRALENLGETECYFPHIPAECDACAELIAGRTFKIADIKGQTNYGKKRKQWVPCAPLHPHCRHRPIPKPHGMIVEEKARVRSKDIRDFQTARKMTI